MLVLTELHFLEDKISFWGDGEGEGTTTTTTNKKQKKTLSKQSCCGRYLINLPRHVEMHREHMLRHGVGEVAVVHEQGIFWSQVARFHRVIAHELHSQHEGGRGKKRGRGGRLLVPNFQQEKYLISSNSSYIVCVAHH